MTLPREAEPRDYPDGRPLPDQPHWRQDFPTDVPEDDLVSRREFTKFLVLTSGAFTAGQGWIGVMSLLETKGPLPEKRIATWDEVRDRRVIEFRYPGEDDPALLILLDDGRLVAYGQQCTHLSCAVIPELDRGELHCPCHKGAFEIEHGRPIAGPPRRPLPLIHTAVRDGVVYATGLELRTV